MQGVIQNTPVHIDDIEKLPRQLRVAFACACAERILPCYRKYFELIGKGQPDKLERMLVSAWDAAQGTELKEDTLVAMIEECMDLIPQPDEEPWVPQVAYAEDAAASVAYALNTILTGASKEAIWASKRLIDSQDQYALRSLGIDWNDPDAEGKVLSYPSRLIELARQNRDVNELHQISLLPVNSWKKSVENIQLRARIESKNFLS